MTPQERRELFLALLEFWAVAYPAPSSEREELAVYWDVIATGNGDAINESWLSKSAIAALRDAQRNLKRAADLYGRGGPMAALFDEQSSRLAKLQIDEARGLTRKQIRAVTQEVRERERKQPTRESVAAALNVSEPTLKRAMKDLEMNGWPPAPPDD